jgi:hypothetical protein
MQNFFQVTLAKVYNDNNNDKQANNPVRANIGYDKKIWR